MPTLSIHAASTQLRLSDCNACSFDVVRDQLGGPRRAFPHSMVLVAGTQAATARANYLALMRLSNLGQVRQPNAL